MSHSESTPTNAENEHQTQVPEPEVAPRAKRRQFSALKAVVLQDGIIDEAEVTAIRKTIYGTGGAGGDAFNIRQVYPG